MQLWVKFMQFFPSVEMSHYFLVSLSNNSKFDKFDLKYILD